MPASIPVVSSRNWSDKTMQGLAHMRKLFPRGGVFWGSFLPHLFLKSHSMATLSPVQSGHPEIINLGHKVVLSTVGGGHTTDLLPDPLPKDPAVQDGEGKAGMQDPNLVYPYIAAKHTRTSPPQDCLWRLIISEEWTFPSAAKRSQQFSSDNFVSVKGQQKVLDWQARRQRQHFQTLKSV